MALMKRLLILFFILVVLPCADAQTCDDLLEQIKQTAPGKDEAVLTLLDTLETSGCIETVGEKSFYWNRGTLKSRLNDYSGAANDLKKLLNLDMSDKDRAAIQSLLGFCLMNLKEYDAAETHLTASIALRPKQTKPYHLLATTRMFKKDRAGAVQAMEALKKVNPADPQLLADVGKFYFDFAFYPEAIQVLEAFLAISPDDPNALFAIGIAHMKQDQPDTAFSWFLKTFKADPGRVIALNNALAILHQKNEHEKAMAILIETTRHRSEIDILQIRANIYEAAGWCGDASHWYAQMATVSSFKKSKAYTEKAEQLKQACPDNFQAPRHVLKYDVQ